MNLTVKVILVFLSSFLLSCENTFKKNKEEMFFLYKSPNDLATKDSIKQYEVINDTIYFKFEKNYWSESSYGYLLYDEIEKENFNLLLEKFLNTIPNINHNYKGFDNPYSFEVKSLKDSKTQFFSEINLLEYSKSTDSIYNYLNELVNLKRTTFLRGKHMNLKIRRISYDLDTLNLSNSNSYLIWKEINFGKNKIKSRNKIQSSYRILLDYWIDYSGEKITDLTTDDLNTFYYNLGDKTYSFKLGRALNLKE